MGEAIGFSRVPLIDISGLRGGPADRDRVVAEIGHAAREVGFLQITGAGVPPALFAGLLAAARRFFALPMDEKMKVYIGASKNHRGYVPEGEEVFSAGGRDRKEAFDLSLDLPPDDPDHLAGNPLLGPNQWPPLPGFADAVMAYYDAVLALGRRLLHAFAQALGEPPTLFDDHVTKPPSQLRLLRYPAGPAADDREADDRETDDRETDAVGIGAHTDYECFTLLRCTGPGLEVRNGVGEWIDVPPVEDAFVVNIGDMFEILTNGEFVATPHRVRRVTAERYSFPLFFSVDYHTRVVPLERFVRPGRPARPGLVAGEHLFAHTAQTFTYLKDRLATGEIVLPAGSVGLSSFGHPTQTAG
ncbi:isopenicillin N synthase family oxygenase [Frankia sp. CNm7]|uniref:Isopenicillin N synthase family oxygenase n=1 Tax=Frankia nepalensis TaxID=1836974 RepID=A0A937RDV7_9ACTN|nr:2-oxoglutarate and iron-dependent oxygenase domain-containing protein [Frankia nepalensis]MBL7495810.1 isopenicillin N synthase family oxygenase [Frankia nepalensis]MBL7513256.1 isopenicillin N synthase family oxygenase [Frankia nepalensis]MBL7519487.1 isopenicillin N synthase family oxygenase [Frankia nepalensis]MBL7628137.1 isopenicillin N synthase family oxygenase [Frankia nepalensis]